MTGEFPAQRASNTENVSIWWRHHVNIFYWSNQNLNSFPHLLHICIGKLVIIGSGNALSPVQCQAITWTNADLLSFGSLGINFSKILIKIQNFSSWKCIWKCRQWNGGSLAKGELTGQKIKQTEYILDIHFFFQLREPLNFLGKCGDIYSLDELSYCVFYLTGILPRSKRNEKYLFQWIESLMFFSMIWPQ